MNETLSATRAALKYTREALSAATDDIATNDPRITEQLQAAIEALESVKTHLLAIRRAAA